VRFRLTINAYKTRIETARELRQALGDFAAEQYKEIWIAKDPAPSLCALLNGDRGWLMFMRTAEEGVRSASLDFSGDPESVIQYRLSNGQIDEYPESWALPESAIRSALEYFIDHAEPAPFIVWCRW
jgi:hypothetical protein